MTSAIALNRVTVETDSKLVLQDVTLDIGRGEVVAVLGPSGSGKTTLLRAVMGFVPLSRGSVWLNGTLASDARHTRVPPEARNLAVVFQSLALWPHLTVRGNLAFGLCSRRLSRVETARRIAQALEEVGLTGLAQRYPHQLSGGEQQRVAVARALVLEPEAVLLDEPLSSLDIGLREELLTLFVRLFRVHRTTCLYVTHSPWEARHISNRVAILDGGRLVFDGARDALESNTGSPFVRRIGKFFRGDTSVLIDR